MSYKLRLIARVPTQSPSDLEDVVILTVITIDQGEKVMYT